MHLENLVPGVASQGPVLPPLPPRSAPRGCRPVPRSPSTWTRCSLLLSCSSSHRWVPWMGSDLTDPSRSSLRAWQCGLRQFTFVPSPLISPRRSSQPQSCVIYLLTERCLCPSQNGSYGRQETGLSFRSENPDQHF